MLGLLPRQWPNVILSHNAQAMLIELAWNVEIWSNNMLALKMSKYLTKPRSSLAERLPFAQNRQPNFNWRLIQHLLLQPMVILPHQV